MYVCVTTPKPCSQYTVHSRPDQSTSTPSRDITVMIMMSVGILPGSSGCNHGFTASAHLSICLRVRKGLGRTGGRKRKRESFIIQSTGREQNRRFPPVLSIQVMRWDEVYQMRYTRIIPRITYSCKCGPPAAVTRMQGRKNCGRWE